MSEQKTYLAIDLKSFYASVECMERGLDPMTTNLLVADSERTEKTICLAVSPALKRYGIPGRARLFEAVQKIKEANARRREKAPGNRLTGKSYSAAELDKNPNLAVDFVIAPPRMALRSASGCWRGTRRCCSGSRAATAGTAPRWCASTMSWPSGSSGTSAPSTPP